jgi:hypothetical protein
MAEQSLFEAQKELLSSTFGQAQTYTNVVIAAGYAGYFGVWSFVTNDLGRRTMFTSALLITISLGAFVLWKVIGMYMRNSVLIRLASVVAGEEQFAVRLVVYKKERQDQNIKLIPVWKVLLTVTVLTAVAAYFILLSAFVHGLWFAVSGP